MSTPAAAQSFTVLRIKRKATDSPLSSLVIQDSPDPRARKRRDVSVRARGVFRLAETVPGSWEGTGEQNDELRTRIEGLLSRPQAGGAASLASSTAPPLPSTSPQPMTSPTPPLSLPSALTASSPSAPGPSTLSPSLPVLPDPPSSSAALQQRYRVVPRASGPASKARAPIGLPPRVLSRAEVEAARAQLVFVDATAELGADAPRGGLGAGQGLGLEDAGDDMASFLPMLKEYLSLEQRDRPPTRIDPEEAEYVYDLYYRDNRSGAVLDAASAAVGALLGYEDLSPPSSVSGSEAEDEADEDSNDEDYYRNDYPEDEDADEDMEEFEDAYSDGEWSRDEESDGGGGEWDYR